MSTKMVTLEIKTACPGEVVRALRERALRLREEGKHVGYYDGRFLKMACEFKADELDRVVGQILASE